MIKYILILLMFPVLLSAQHGIVKVWQINLNWTDFIEDSIHVFDMPPNTFLVNAYYEIDTAFSAPIHFGIEGEQSYPFVETRWNEIPAGIVRNIGSKLSPGKVNVIGGGVVAAEIIIPLEKDVPNLIFGLAHAEGSHMEFDGSRITVNQFQAGPYLNISNIAWTTDRDNVDILIYPVVNGIHDIAHTILQLNAGDYVESYALTTGNNVTLTIHSGSLIIWKSSGNYYFALSDTQEYLNVYAPTPLTSGNLNLMIQYMHYDHE